jgi:hypothetical protein
MLHLSGRAQGAVMRFSRLVGFLVVVAVVFGIVSTGSAFGSDSESRHIVVSDHGFESFVGNANVAGVVRASVTGFGRGVETSTLAPCPHPSPLAICIDVVLHFRHDTLHWHDDGLLVAWTGPPFPGLVHLPDPPFPNVGAVNRFSDVLTITGGTGRFAGATGQLASKQSWSRIVESDPVTGFVKKRVQSVSVGSITLQERAGDSDND